MNAPSTKDVGRKTRVTRSRLLGFVVTYIAIYSVILLAVGWTIDHFRDAPFRIDRFTVSLLFGLIPMSIGIHLAILRAKGTSSRQFSLMTLFIAITGASVLFGAMSWSRQRDVKLSATRQQLEATLSSIIGQGRASVGSSTLVIVKRSTFNDNDLAKIVDLHRPLTKIGSPIDFIALEGTKVSDLGISRLGDIDSLEWCFLGQTSVSDASIKSLEQLPKLKTLDVHSTRMTNDGLLRLSNSRPEINISPRPNPHLKSSPLTRPTTGAPGNK